MVQVSCPAPRRTGSVGVDETMANRRKGVGVIRSSSTNPRSKERQVGQFVLSKTMGEGTFGEVKLAVHKPTSERVAAKVRGYLRNFDLFRASVSRVLNIVEIQNCPDEQTKVGVVTLHRGRYVRFVFPAIQRYVLQRTPNRNPQSGMT